MIFVTKGLIVDLGSGIKEEAWGEEDTTRQRLNFQDLGREAKQQIAFHIEFLPKISDQILYLRIAGPKMLVPKKLSGIFDQGSCGIGQVQLFVCLSPPVLSTRLPYIIQRDPPAAH